LVVTLTFATFDLPLRFLRLVVCLPVAVTFVGFLQHTRLYCHTFGSAISPVIPFGSRLLHTARFLRCLFTLRSHLRLRLPHALYCDTRLRGSTYRTRYTIHARGCVWIAVTCVYTLVVTVTPACSRLRLRILRTHHADRLPAFGFYGYVRCSLRTFPVGLLYDYPLFWFYALLPAHYTRLTRLPVHILRGLFATDYYSSTHAHTRFAFTHTLRIYGYTTTVYYLPCTTVCHLRLVLTPRFTHIAVPTVPQVRGYTRALVTPLPLPTQRLRGCWFYTRLPFTQLDMVWLLLPTRTVADTHALPRFTRLRLLVTTLPHRLRCCHAHTVVTTTLLCYPYGSGWVDYDITLDLHRLPTTCGYTHVRCRFDVGLHGSHRYTAVYVHCTVSCRATRLRFVGFFVCRFTWFYVAAYCI